jgi:hypothetical protein
MNYIPLPESAIRQSIDSATIFQETKRVQREANSYAGGMYWKRQDGYEYLVKTSRDNKQERIGKRTPETELVYDTFTHKKASIEARLKSLKQNLTEAERLNRALKVGRVPNTVIKLLDAIDKAGLSEHFIVVGTHALYAYEAAASVRIVQSALATQDVDLLWDARRKVKFFTTMAKLNVSMLSILQQADASFIRKDDQISTAINDKGFEVDFLRRQPEGDDAHPVRLSDDENDCWVIQAPRANILTNAPRFTQIVTATNGQMATMTTIAPSDFVSFKLWMANEAENREPGKRRRDAAQAAIVQELIDEALLDTLPTTR